MNKKKILEKATKGIRIEPEEALLLLRQADLLELGETANKVAKSKCGQTASYIIDRNINYTNICQTRCRFCAFSRDEKDIDGYVISYEDLDNKIRETIELGGMQILLQGAHHPKFKIDFYVDLISHIKKNHLIHIHAFSPPEINHISQLSGLDNKSTLERLINAGLGSLPGGGAEILVDSVRIKVSPTKCKTNTWLEIMEIAHGLGLKTSATMMFGHVESIEDRIEHLTKIRGLQDRTMGFTAFIPWTFQGKNTELASTEVLRPVGGHEYLKTLALSRLFLDNFKNIQGSWVTQGHKIGQLSLIFGANDLGSIMIEENVVSAAGCSYRIKESEICRLIEGAGLNARKRDQFYNFMD